MLAEPGRRASLLGLLARLPAGGAAVRLGLGRKLFLCTTVRPLYTGFNKKIGPSIPEKRQCDPTLGAEPGQAGCLPAGPGGPPPPPSVIKRP